MKNPQEKWIEKSSYINYTILTIDTHVLHQAAQAMNKT